MKCFINGVDTASVDLELVERYIPPLPNVEDQNVQIDGRDGEIDFGMVYGPRVIQLVFFLTEYTELDYYDKIAAAVEMFNPRIGELTVTFDDLPGRVYSARPIGTVPIDKGGTIRTLAIPLKMHQPFPESTDVSSGWEYGQGYSYGMGLRYGDEYSYTVSSSPDTFEIYHAGNVPIKPKFRITGHFTNLNLSDGRGNTLVLTRVNGPSDYIDINCEKGTVKLNNSQNIYSQSNGCFFVLPKGETTFTATASGTVNFTITFAPFRHRYLF
ncbi:phage tail domain-containing protein [Paenibacillus koleovorans]|uniref:phage tail domain-containing protein n=1 Tax=Paenibacillus koleovorans TaxID=121608 RepID=UPI000FDC38E8|nr:phage tail domain-containing protein [Paenibacillus koleovorans]